MFHESNNNDSYIKAKFHTKPTDVKTELDGNPEKQDRSQVSKNNIL